MGSLVITNMWLSVTCTNVGLFYLDPEFSDFKNGFPRKKQSQQGDFSHVRYLLSDRAKGSV